MSGIPERCPFCGGYETGIYCYGMPSGEAWRAVAPSHGRLMNGGCCVSSASPKCRCHDCGRDFGALSHAACRYDKLRDWMSKLKRIDFQTSGFTLRSEVSLAPDGAEVYCQGAGKGHCRVEMPAGWYRRIVRLLLDRLYVMDWQRDYVNAEVVDGTQWELTLHFGNGRWKRTICGSNAYPPNDERMTRLFLLFFRRAGWGELARPNMGCGEAKEYAAEDVLQRALKGQERLFYWHAVREKMHRSPHCPCGSCRHFDGWDIECPTCTHFPDGVSPADVYFDGAPCPSFRAR